MLYLLVGKWALIGQFSRCLSLNNPLYSKVYSNWNLSTFIWTQRCSHYLTNLVLDTYCTLWNLVFFLRGKFLVHNFKSWLQTWLVKVLPVSFSAGIVLLQVRVYLLFFSYNNEKESSEVTTPLVRHIQKHGNSTVYQWRTGKIPSVWMSPTFSW